MRLLHLPPMVLGAGLLVILAIVAVAVILAIRSSRKRTRSGARKLAEPGASDSPPPPDRGTPPAPLPHRPDTEPPTEPTATIIKAPAATDGGRSPYSPGTDSADTDATSADPTVDPTSASIGSTHSGSVDAGSAHTGSVGAGAAYAGSTDASSTDASSADAGSTDAGSAHTGSAYTGSAHAGSTDAGSTDAGSAHTGSAHTGSAHTGSMRAGSAGAADTERPGTVGLDDTGSATTTAAGPTTAIDAEPAEAGPTGAVLSEVSGPGSTDVADRWPPVPGGLAGTEIAESRDRSAAQLPTHPEQPARAGQTAPAPAPPSDEDPRDRLLRVLLADPERALRAVDDLAHCRGQLDRLTESVEYQRRQLAVIARRLRGAGLTAAQVARLAGFGEGELVSLLATHAPSPTQSRPAGGSPARPGVLNRAAWRATGPLPSQPSQSPQPPRADIAPGPAPTSRPGSTAHPPRADLA
ncbi:MAG TPA: hypothetical protein VGH89_09015, partial [Pseudonocardia sp.]